MGTLKFKKGEFITHNKAPMVFAIFGGETYAPEKVGDPFDRSLICYYDPCYLEVDADGDESVETVFDCDVDGSGCPWTISDADENWRLCNEREVEDAIRLLFEIKKLAWDETTKSLRHVHQNETLRFDDKKKTNTTSANKTTIITLKVDDNWVQTTAIRAKNEELSNFIQEECKKLDRSFSTSYGNYNSNYYPTNRSIYDDEGRDAWGNWYNGYD